MERTRVLIDKLKEQFEAGASPAQLLLTIQLLQQELSLHENAGRQLGTSKVAVVLPKIVLSSVMTATPPAPVAEEKPAASVAEPAPVMKTITPLTETEEKEVFILADIPEEHSQYTPPLNGQIDFIFEKNEEAPTIAAGIASKEINDLVTHGNNSLNDKLKQEKTELSEVLKETPIKDLRKAIGINDRYVFINDLFRGDEAMYERSIKTINAFNIYPEAEYWMNRELKVKLGWDDAKENVVHFYQLVKRRFS